MALFSTIQIYEQDGSIVFKDPAESEPFASYPKGSVKFRNYGISGFLFEREVDSANIAFVEEADDILDITATPYDTTRSAVYIALNAFINTNVITGTVTSSNTVLENLAELESFDMVSGNNVSITYYPGIDTGNPSGNTNNIWTIVYSTGATVIATKTLSYNADDNIISVTTT